MSKAFPGARIAAVALTAAALVAGCSSTTSGSGTSGGGPAAGGSAPTVGSVGGSVGGSTGGSGNFCKDWNSIDSDLTNITSGDVRAKLVGKFDTLAAEAPAAVKADVDMIDQYVQSLVSGNPDPGKAQQFGQAFAHVGVWIAQNC